MTIDAAPGPVFVVGLWRSGTSLLYTLLNQHPGIALMYEADLPLLRQLFTDAGSKADWLERWEFWNSALTRHGIDAQQIPHSVSDLPSAVEIVWKQYAGGAIYGEKSPNYYDSLQWLSREFPNARFVVIWRDPADICRSIIRAAQAGSSFFAKRGITHRALIGTRRLKSECEALVGRGVPLHQVQYEEMIEEPERVLAGICSFLQIPFDPRMASLKGADRSAIYDADHHAGVKSKTIGAKACKDCDDVLPVPLKSKIDRYVSYWQQEYGGNWPLYPKMPTGNGLKPGLLERSWDEVLFRGLRAFDQFTSLVYCYAPISLLRRYRSAKSISRSPEAAKDAIAKEPAALSEVSTRG
ncbi:MAG: sulfotransferase [Candidatus Sulfotelmatobacter sp.]